MISLPDFIKMHEGLELKPYRCPAGKLTIGYGRNLEDVGISKEEAEWLLESDISACRRDIYDIFGPGWSIDYPRLVALIDMRYNLGPSGFRGFKRMIAAIKREDWPAAAWEARDSKWYSQVGRRGEEVARVLATGVD
jgi:lysozyme